MKHHLLTALILLFSLPSFASVVGISTHPMSRDSKVLSAQMTGHMSQQHEMAMGLRYTDQMRNGVIGDVFVAGGQTSRDLAAGGGLDVKLISEKVYRPRVSLKPYFQYQKFEDVSTSIVGFAPTIRKGFSQSGVEFFPYLALPSGLRIDTETNEFVYYSSLSMGASLPVPGNEKLILSLEGNVDFGASSDYVGVLVSWAWN